MAAAIKLELSNLGLYGRDAELSVLQDCYRRLEENSSDGSGASEDDARAGGAVMALVSGGAGTGKSTLVKGLSEMKMNCSAEPIFASGKFDYQREGTGKPYSALCSAFDMLIELVISAYGETDRRRMGKEINEAIGSEGLRVLLPVAPRIQKLFSFQRDAQKKQTENNESVTASADGFNRLKFAVHSLLRSLCSKSHPIILFLDDLQWADQASLELIRSIATDMELQHLLLIGAYRDEEVDEASHPLATVLREIEAETKSITKILIGDLNIETVTKLISGLLRLDETRVAELSEVVHQRTGGNAFFVHQFLAMLQKRNLIAYSLTKYEWIWDIEQIRSETHIGDNVVEFVALKIQGLPPHIATVLKLMACFPSNLVEVALLESIMRGLDEEEFRVVCESFNLVEILEEASQEALVDRIGIDSFKFTHDRIREGAYSLIPAGRERDTFHLRIGEVVMELLSLEPRRQSLKFVAADQLNHGVEYITDEKQRLDLASLNIEAGKMALSISAFVPAAEFFDKGLVLIQNDRHHWNTNYNLSLNLYSLAVETANCNGDFELLERLMDEIVANASCLSDKLSVICILVESLTVQQKLEEAMNVAYDILVQLGQSFPKRFLSVHARNAYHKTKETFQAYSDDELLSLPEMTDENMIIASRLISHLVRCSYFLQDLDSMCLLCCRNIQCMLQFGLNQDTPYMFSKYAMILCGGMGEIKDGVRFGSLAIKLLDRYNEREAVVSLVVNSFVLHWTRPAQDQIDPLFKGASIGMANGDINHAFLCTVGYLYFFFHSGLPLTSFEKDASRQMESYKQDLALIEILPLWQLALNLMNKSDDPLVLSGEAMTQEEYLQDAIPTAKQKVFLMRMQLAYYFGDTDLAIEMLESCEKLMMTIRGHFVHEVFTFFGGLIYMEQARRKRRRYYKKMAKNKIRIVQKWVKEGAVNCVHKLWLLNAEYATFNDNKRGDNDEIKKAYDTAISVSTKSGFLHDAALANERAGIWFRSLGDNFWASSYISRAQELYHEWGATAKADQLERLWSLNSDRISDECAAGRSAKGKSRFDNSISEQHRRTSFAGLSTRGLHTSLTSTSTR